MKISFFMPLHDKGIRIYSDHLIAAMEKDTEIQVHRVGLEKIFRINFHPFRYFFALGLYKKLGKEMNVGDIAHIQHDYSLFCLWNNPFENMYRHFRKQIHIPTVLTAHEIVHRTIRDEKNIVLKLKYMLKRLYYILFQKYMRYIEVGMFEECDAVIVHTRKSFQTLVERGVNASRIHVIPHGIANVEKSTLTKEQAKEKFKVSGKYVLTTFGLIHERKGQDIVIDVLKELDEDCVYLVAGTIEKRKVFKKYFAFLQDRVKELGLDDRVIFTDFINDNDVKDLMMATDIIIYPAREITASGSISDAIAYGKAIIASDLEFVREINERIKCIATYSHDDTNSMVNMIKSMRQNEDQRIGLEDKANKYAALYGYEYSAKKTIEVYKIVQSVRHN